MRKILGYFPNEIGMDQFALSVQCHCSGRFTTDQEHHAKCQLAITPLAWGLGIGTRIAFSGQAVSLWIGPVSLQCAAFCQGVSEVADA